jgi:uncharacterized protein YdaU (DUF1376 family)
MAEFPAFPLWTDAYLGDTTHLSTIEHGAYLLLLFTAWRSPTYDLPDDDALLAKYCRLTRGQWARVKPAVMAYWKPVNGRLSNGRLLDERDSVRRKVSQRSDAGKASALKRLNRGPTPVQRNADENPTTKATATATTSRTEEGAANAVALKSPKRVLGTRWPENQAVPESWFQPVIAKFAALGRSPPDMRLESEKFAAYWAGL